MALTSKTAAIAWVDHAAGGLIPPPATFLTPTEQVQADTLRFARRREEWLLGRWTAARLIEGIPDLRGAVLKNETSGAPYFERNGKHLPGCVSLSHRAGEGFCAYSRELQVGADVELVEPRSDAFIRDYFTIEEQQHGAEFTQNTRKIWANLIWSAKEAVLKTLRTGLRMDTCQVSIDLMGDIQIENCWQALEIKCSAAAGTWIGLWQRRGSHVFTLAALSNALYNRVELHEIGRDRPSRGTKPTIIELKEN